MEYAQNQSISLIRPIISLNAELFEGILTGKATRGLINEGERLK